MKATSKGRIKIILKGLALVLWCVVIFMFSANNADESNKQSNAVFNTVIEFVNPVYDSLDATAQAEYKDTATFIIRKLAHFRIRLAWNTGVHQFFKGEKAWIQRAFCGSFFLHLRFKR